MYTSPAAVTDKGLPAFFHKLNCDINKHFSLKVNVIKKIFNIICPCFFRFLTNFFVKIIKYKQWGFYPKKYS